jgi:hypothetical protein
LYLAQVLEMRERRLSAKGFEYWEALFRKPAAGVSRVFARIPIAWIAVIRPS